MNIQQIHINNQDIRQKLKIHKHKKRQNKNSRFQNPTKTQDTTQNSQF